MSHVTAGTELRAANRDDINFILATWLKSFRGSDVSRGIPSEILFSEHQNLIKNILLNSTVTMLVSSEDSTQILGYIVHDINLPIVHYIYVKYPYRKLGLARHLFNNFYNDRFELNQHIHCTHRTNYSRWGDLKDKYKLVYNPYLLELSYAKSNQGIPS